MVMVTSSNLAAQNRLNESRASTEAVRAGLLSVQKASSELDLNLRKNLEQSRYDITSANLQLANQ
jgi:hypothetical protein